MNGLKGAIVSTILKKPVNPYKTGQALRSRMPKTPKAPTI